MQGSETSALMWFDGPSQFLPIFHYLMWFDGPKNLMWFNGPKSRFSPFKTSCDLMDPKHMRFLRLFNCFPLWKPHVFWWTHYSTKTSCVLVDPKPHVFWWTLDDFQGPFNHMRFLGPPNHMSAQKTHVIWWTQPNFAHFSPTSCALMDPDFQTSLGPSNHMRFYSAVEYYFFYVYTFQNIT